MENTFAGMFLSFAIALIILSVIVYQHNRKKGLIAIAISCVIAVVIGIFAIPIIANEAKRYNNLRKDSSDLEIIEDVGIIEDVSSYARSRAECLINGVEYRFLKGVDDSVGDLVSGLNLKFNYLKNSKYIVEYEIIDPQELRDDCWVGSSDLEYFECKYSSIASWRDLDDLVNDYIYNYYLNTDENLCKKYLDEAKFVTKYYRDDLNFYVSIVSFADYEDSYIYMMFDPDNGFPVYFEEHWY